MKTASGRLTEPSAFDSFFYDRFPLSKPGERVLSLYASKHLTPSRLAKQSVCVYGRGGVFNSLAPARPVGSIRFRLACDRSCFRFRVRHASLPIEARACLGHSTSV